MKTTIKVFFPFKRFAAGIYLLKVNKRNSRNLEMPAGLRLLATAMFRKAKLRDKR